MFKKRYRCYCPTFQQDFVCADVTFFKTILFSLSSIATSQGEDDNLFIYSISSPISAPVEYPIIQVYSRCKNPLVLNPTLAASSLDLVHINDILIVLRIDKR